MMPPAAPEPMTRKSISVCTSNLTCSSFIGGLLLRLLWRLILTVVKTEGRLEVKLVFKADQLPSNLIVIATVFRIGEHPCNGQRANQLEERSLFDGLEQSDL